MKCLLLLLASGLVTCDKLDRTYLPPPGAKYSGGTLDDLNPPLKYPKETYTGAIQDSSLAGAYPDMIGVSRKQNFEKEMSTIPINYSASILPNDFSKTSFYPTSEYLPMSRPVLSYSPPSNFPSSSYLPSKHSYAGTQSNSVPYFNSGFESISTTKGIRPGVDQKDSGYYYIPAIQSFRNGVKNQRYNMDGFPNTGFIPFSTQGNNGQLSGNMENYKYIPKTATTNDIVKNYQPGVFGYYGGNPMIMISKSPLPQEPRNTKLGENELNVPSLINQEKVKNNNKLSARPFQTPLVQPNSRNAFKPTNSKTKFTVPNVPTPQFPATTTSSFLNENVPTAFDQRNDISVYPKYRQDRPQAESERNAVIINYENTISPEGYSYRYDTSNGIHADETGIATNGVRAKGSYSYTGDDGKIYTVTYTADENGFQPRGDHLPTTPPIPEAIQKVIDQAARDKAAGIIDDGFYDERKYGHMNYQGAMGRYNPSKKISNIVSNGTNRKHSGLPRIKNKNESNNTPDNRMNVAKSKEQPIEYRKNLQNININDENQTRTKDNKSNGQNNLSTSTRSNLKKSDQNKDQSNNQNNSRRPITSVTDDQITNAERTTTFQPQNPDVKYKPSYSDADISDINTQDDTSQNKIPSTSPVATLTDDGYYYVPPIIKFNPNAKNPAFTKNSYLTTNKLPKAIVTERTGFDGSPTRKIVADEYAQLPFNPNTVTTEPARQPYISGPDDREKVISDKSDTDRLMMYPNNLDLSLFGFNTTPMTTQTVQPNQFPEGNSQYYQSTTNPIAFDQTLPSAVENRVNIPLGNPGITVSQDFVTTTYRPTISDNGVLEVNQNVKIYGLGKPETTTANNGYSKNPIYNNGFYTTSTPNQELTFSGYPSFYPGAIQDTTFREVPNENLPYGNDYFTTPRTESRILTGPYPNENLNREAQGDISTVPNAPILVANSFGNPEPAQVVTSTAVDQNQGLGGRVIGEDFSGPKQPQKFDPETGYYY